MAEPVASFFVECFCIGVDEDHLRRLDERASAFADRMANDGEHVRYLGSVLMSEDDVVPCFLGGTAERVRHAAFARILETAGSPWAARER
jgi:hypothetical protein